MSKDNKKHKRMIFGSKTRFFGFRDTRRLATMRRFIGLFTFIGVLGILVFMTGLSAFALWLLLVFITLGFVTRYNDNWFNFIGNALTIGIIMFVGAVVLRILVELLYTRLEKRDLKKNPDGAQKYLNVMRASFKVEMINLALFAVVIAAGAVARAAGFGDNTETIVFAVIAVVAFIASRALLQRTYNKVRDEIIEIKQERQIERQAQKGTP